MRIGGSIEHTKLMPTIKNICGSLENPLNARTIVHGSVMLIMILDMSR